MPVLFNVRGKRLTSFSLCHSLRHPNVVWVYGMVLPDVEVHEGTGSGDDSPDDSDRPSSSMQGAPGTVRPPAIVTEFMSGGSLRSALSRRADFVQGMLPRVMISFDAAKVRMC